MKCLSKEQRDRLTEIQDRLTAAAESVETAYADLEDRVRIAWEETADKAVADYNAILSDFEELRGEVESDINLYIGEKSEKWQEGYRGQAYCSWLQAWEQTLDELPADPPECPQAPDCPHPDDYPEEP